MKAIITGAGRTGAMLAKTLADAGHDVAVIDNDLQAFSRLPRGLIEAGHIRVLHDDGSAGDSMEEAGIRDADAFIAVTNRDALNGLAALKAKLIYRVPYAVCKLEDEDLRQIYEPSGVVVVNPAGLAIEQAVRAIADGQARSQGAPR